MRGMDDQTDHMFSYLPPESPVRPDHRCARSAGLPMRP